MDGPQIKLFLKEFNFYKVIKISRLNSIRNVFSDNEKRSVWKT